MTDNVKSIKIKTLVQRKEKQKCQNENGKEAKNIKRTHKVQNNLKKTTGGNGTNRQRCLPERG